MLAVAGTHGKTTTSSMLAWILEDAGLAPGFLIGGIPKTLAYPRCLPGAPRRAGWAKPVFVIEADEYDTAFLTSAASLFTTGHARCNNLEFDHADIFADLAAIETSFTIWCAPCPAKAGWWSTPRGQLDACWQRLLDAGQRFGESGEWSWARWTPTAPATSCWWACRKAG